jgi:hypothetical protein
MLLSGSNGRHLIFYVSTTLRNHNKFPQQRAGCHLSSLLEQITPLTEMLEWPSYVHLTIIVYNFALSILNNKLSLVGTHMKLMAPVERRKGRGKGKMESRKFTGKNLLQIFSLSQRFLRIVLCAEIRICF